jgi:restriction system-associated AAA family ATPase
MKIREIKLHNQYRSLEPFEFKFLKHPLLMGRLDPMCLVGLNGCGKSNFLELLADIFFEVEKFFLEENKIYTADRTSSNYFAYADKESKENIFFEIVYEINESISLDNPSKINKKLGGDVIKIERSNSTKGSLKFFLEKEVLRQPDFFNSATVEEIFIELETNSFDDCKNLRDKYIPLVIAYTSGLNDLLTLPFIDVQDFYAQQVAREALKPTDANLVIPSPNLLLLNYDSNASIVVSNFLLADEVKCQVFSEQLRIRRMNSFRIVIRLNKLAGSKKVEITNELSTYIRFLEDCAAISEIKLDDKKGNEYVFDFVVNDVVKELFREKFHTPQKLFEVLNKLNLLNTLCIKGGYREKLKKKRKQGQLLKFPQIASLDKIFSIEKIDLVLNEPLVRTGYEKISDGEHQFIHIIGGILLFDEDVPQKDILYLLDEPDTHFNPLWRSDFFYQLENVLNKKNVELIITTHSPFILSDCHGYNTFKFTREGEKVTFLRIEDEIYGASFESITKNLFYSTNEKYRHFNNQKAKMAYNDIQILYDEIGAIQSLTEWNEKFESLLQRIRMLGESNDRFFVLKQYAEKEQSFKLQNENT